MINPDLSGKKTNLVLGMMLIILTVISLMVNGCCKVTDVDPSTNNKWTVLNGLTRGNMIYSIHGTSGNNIFAVGGGGTLLKYNGSNWSPIETSTSEIFFNVWSPSPDVVYLLSSDQYIRKYSNGSFSTVYTDPDPTQKFNPIAGFSADDIFVGGIGTICHYNGTSWSTMEIDSEAYIWGLWGIDGNHVYAVDMDGGIHFYDGSSWTKQVTYSGVWFSSIYGTAADDIYATASSGTNRLYHYDGTTWEVVSNISLPSGAGLYAVWGSASNDIYVVGSKGTIFHYDGSSWEQTFDIPAVEYHGIWGTSSSNVLIAGEKGILLRKNGSSWTEELGEYRGFFMGVYGTSATNMYFGGRKLTNSLSTNVFSYNGTTLTPVETGSTHNIMGMWGEGSDHFFAVTEKDDNSQMLQFDGSSWSIDYEADMTLFDIWGSSSSDVYAVGYCLGVWPNISGQIMHYDGSVWSTLKVFPDHTLLRVSGASSNEVYFSGKQDPLGAMIPVLYFYDGSTFESITLPSASITDIDALFYLSGTGLYIGTSAGSAYRLYLYSGGSWTEVGSFSKSIQAIWASASNNVFLGTAGGVYRYNGSSFSGPMYPYCDLTNRIWGTDKNNIYLVGNYGVIMRYGQ